MKKASAVIISLVLVLFMFTSCAGNTTQWDSSVNETFEDVVVYKYGDTISAQFDSNCNIKIEDNDYDHFVKYINDLKEAGFEFISSGDIPENYNLSNGQANWRGTNGEVYLQLIFNSSDSATYEMFGCNVQIYGYSQKPESWGSDDENSTDENSEEETTASTDTEETTVSED